MPNIPRDRRFFRPEYIAIGGREFAIGAVAGSVLALLGPVGTFDADLSKRLLFWIPLLTLGALGGGLLARQTSRHKGPRESHWRRLTILTLAIGLPMGIVGWGLARLLFTPQLQYSVSVFLAPALLISAVMTALLTHLNSPDPETKAKPGTNPKLLARLPAHQRTADILAVSSEDHYLRVFTDAGESLILLRLSDAIAELDGIEGAQVHRSWWVARNAIGSAERHGRNWQFSLNSGLIVPVSRVNVRVLREAGWLN
jgi:hypothetical protein